MLQCLPCFAIHTCTNRKIDMTTSANGNIFHVTDCLWGEFASHLWIALTKASDAELWWFLWSVPAQMVKQTTERPVIWDAIALIMTSLLWNWHILMTRFLTAQCSHAYYAWTSDEYHHPPYSRQSCDGWTGSGVKLPRVYSQDDLNTITAQM